MFPIKTGRRRETQPEHPPPRKAEMETCSHPRLKALGLHSCTRFQSQAMSQPKITTTIRSSQNMLRSPFQKCLVKYSASIYTKHKGDNALLAPLTECQQQPEICPPVSKFTMDCTSTSVDWDRSPAILSAVHHPSAFAHLPSLAFSGTDCSHRNCLPTPPCA